MVQSLGIRFLTFPRKNSLERTTLFVGSQSIGRLNNVFAQRLGNRLFDLKNYLTSRNMIDFLTSLGILEIGIGAVAAASVTHWFDKRRYKERLIDDWYGESLALIQRCQRLGRRVTEYQDTADFGLFLEKVDPIADDIADHIGRGRKSGVDEEAVRDLDHFHQFATGIAILIQQFGEEGAAEFLDRTISQSEERLGDRADEIDIEDLGVFLKYFDMSGIERRSGVDPDDFDDETANQILDSIDKEGMSQAIESIRGESDGDSEKGTAISEVFQFNFDEIGEHLDPAMDATMTEYLRGVMIYYADEVADRMEARRR